MFWCFVLHVTTVKDLQSICKNVLEVGTCKIKHSNIFANVLAC